MSLITKIYEHLKTKRKYNTLQVKYETLKAELEDKITEYNQLKRQYILEKNTWETKFVELTKKNMKGVKKDVSNTKPKSVRVSRKEQENNK